MWGRLFSRISSVSFIAVFSASLVFAEVPDKGALFEAVRSGDVGQLNIHADAIEAHLDAGGQFETLNKTKTFYLLATLLFSNGDNAASEHFFRRSAEASREEGLWLEEAGLNARYELAGILQLNDDHTAALQTALELKGDLERLGAIDQQIGRSTLVMIGGAYLELEFWALADPIFQDVLAYAQAADPPDRFHIAAAANALSVSLRGQERFEEAIPFARLKLETTLEDHAADSELGLTARAQLGTALAQAAHLNEAREVLQAVLADLETSGLSLERLEIDTRNLLSRVADAEGRYLDSRSLRRDVSEGIVTTGSLNEKLEAMDNLAKTALVEGNYALFVSGLGEIAEFVEANPELPQERAAMARVRQSEFVAATDLDFSLAAKYLPDAIQQLEALLKPGHVEILRAKSVAIKLRRAEADMADALKGHGAELYLSDGGETAARYSDEDLNVLRDFAAAQTASGFPWDGFMEYVNYANALTTVGRFSEAHDILDEQDKFVARPKQAGIALALPFGFMVKEARGRVFMEQSDFAQAVASYRDGVDELLDLLREMRWASAFANTTPFDRYGQIFGAAAATAAWHANKNSETADNGYFESAFETIQMAGYGPAAASVARASVRKSNNQPDLRRLVSELEALTNFNRGSTDGSLEAPAEDAEARRARERRISFIHTEIDLRFPEYFGLQVPQSVPLSDITGDAETPGLLKEDEALIVILPMLDVLESKHQLSGLVLAVTRDGTAWAPFPAPFLEMGADITLLHYHLDPKPMTDSVLASLRAPLSAVKPGESAPNATAGGSFAYDRAARLYQTFFGAPDVARLIADKPNWTIVPFGAALSVPFAALITHDPDPDAGEIRSADAMRQVGWLGHERALTIVPSINALKSLRNRTAERTEPSLAYFGIGDPAFNGAFESPLPIVDDIIAQRSGGLGALPRLPGTRREVETLAKHFGAPAGAVALGDEATEEFIYALNESGDLSQARIVHFATHGLLSGAFEGLSEPALALSPPAVGQRGSDGLLTASEAAQLDLNAEWVILSACDTFGNEGLFGDGLGGLAQGFFNAGAQSLLISQWRVDDRAAERLTTETVTRSDQGASKAEALRQSMIELSSDRARDGAGVPNAHPSIWAPFVLVGSG